MSDDVRADARRLREGITPEKWVKWEDFEAKEFTFDGIPRRDAEFIAAAPTLVDRLLAELDRVEGQAALDVGAASHGADLIRRQAIERRNEHDAALATLQQVRDIETHNGAPVTPDNLRYAATHGALSANWIYDVLTGLAHILDGGTR